MKGNNKIQELYTGRASFYERVFVDFLGWGKQLETYFRRSEYIRSEFKILDAGCGTGVVTRILYQLALEKRYVGVQFHAFDLTRSMLDLLQTWVINEGAMNIELKQADVLEPEALPSDWNYHDLIVTSAMLEYLPRPDVRAALVNLKQMLKHEGILLVFITRRNILTRWLAAKWWKTNLYSESEIEAFLHDSGFDKVNFKKFSRGWSNSIIVVEATK